MKQPKSMWDRQEGETNRAYNAFRVYRNMGALRTLKKAAEKYYGDAYFVRTSAKNRNFEYWSSNHNWVARCAAYDDEEDRIYLLEQREGIKKMNKRQASLGAAMQGKATDRLLAILPDELTPDQASRLAKMGVDIERPARGEATEISEHKGTVGLNLIKIDPEIAKKVGDLLAQKEED